MLEEAEGDVTGAASYIEHFPRCRNPRGGGGGRGTRVEGAYEVVPGGSLDRWIKERAERERNAHFHNRWMPSDMKSFMVSYEDATLLNTPATEYSLD